MHTVGYKNTCKVIMININCEKKIYTFLDHYQRGNYRLQTEAFSCDLYANVYYTLLNAVSKCTWFIHFQ